ncbi:MAG: helix-turn-helix domain-containing protein [Candidatus Diapherotrites archaeon]|uniref:DNA helicase n=1 Tax=Candidatus Iainarchaeum sp. TaxID=3101447 RepID=A0A8T3YRD4_9ARCH|nr:helix-turn-helix domain-containing protein [Candidatus Diapherotrites archaeon]
MASEGAFGQREDNPFVEKFEAFFKNRLVKEIERLVADYPSKKSLNVDFRELEHWEPELADELLVNSDVCLEAAEQAIKRIDVPLLELEEDDFAPHIRVFNLPLERQPILRDISASHIGKLITVEGVVRQVTDVLPKLKYATWECTRCGAAYKIPQTKNQTKTPSFCAECKNRMFSLKEETSEFEDYQKIQIQEPLELLKGSEQATNLDIYVSDDIVNSISPGDRTKITGILRLMPPKEKKVVYGRYLEAIHLEETAREFEEVEISREEEEEIKKLAVRDDVYEMLIQSIAPHIYGHEVMKESIALQLFGGVKKNLPNDQTVRGNIHVLLVGDPGVAKSAILRATDSIAPKSIYVAGKTSTGAGLSATAVKDEFGEGGWTIKAGALVLASGGMAMVDEFDKMEPGDRSAMHESMEQQCYHKDFEIMLADGSTHRIGELVDGFMEENKGKVMHGKDCEILETGNLLLPTTDFRNVFCIAAKSVSRHKAPEYFIELTYSNGRKIKVTPDHPVYVYDKNGFSEIPAEKVKEGSAVPAVKKYPSLKQDVKLAPATEKGRKEILLPAGMNGNVARVLGYVATEGYSYRNIENRYAEIGVCNTDAGILADMEKSFSSAFSAKLNLNMVPAWKKENATKDITTVRCSSKELYSYFESNFPELMQKARAKRAPNKIKKANQEEIKNFLQAAFLGDGFIDSERFGYRTASYKLACDYQDLLLQMGIYSYIAGEKGEFYKTVVSGTGNMELFLGKVVSDDDKRREKLARFVERSKKRESGRNLLPLAIAEQINTILKSLKASDGYIGERVRKEENIEAGTAKKHLEKASGKILLSEQAIAAGNPREIRKAAGISIAEIARKTGISGSMVTYIERGHAHGSRQKLLETARRMASEKIADIKKSAEEIAALINSDLKFLKITKVEKIANADSKWAYDVSIEPTHCFISSGIVLHNCISVAKAGIVTKFKTETSILAAANPKYSRFDPYQPFIEQIDLPASLISRFDLFFMIKDVLDRTKDAEIAGHILKSHKAGEMMLQRQKKGINSKDKELEEITELITPKISGELLKKYISYARQNIFPVLADDSMKEISEFYVSLRDQGRKEGAYTATHRQLEGLIRLSEASARVRLSDFVERRDVERAIRLVRTSLQDMVTDPETGKIDIDIITSGQTHTTLSNLKKILGIIKEKAQELDMVPIEEVITESKALGIESDKVRDLLDKLSKSGDIYTPRHGFVKPTKNRGE